MKDKIFVLKDMIVLKNIGRDLFMFILLSNAKPIVGGALINIPEFI